MATTNTNTCTLKPADVTKLEKLAQLKAEVKALEKEMKPKLQAQPVGTFKVGARLIQLTEVAKTSIRYKPMIVDNLGADWIEQHKLGYCSESVNVQFTLLGRA